MATLLDLLSIATASGAPRQASFWAVVVERAHVVETFEFRAGPRDVEAKQDEKIGSTALRPQISGNCF